MQGAGSKRVTPVAIGLAYMVLGLDDLFGLEGFARVAPEGNDACHGQPRFEIGPTCFASWEIPPEMPQKLIFRHILSRTSK